MPQKEWLHLLEDGLLLEAINCHGGIPEAINNSPDYFATFAPVLRSDFWMSEHYAPNAGPKITAPMLALGGQQDSYVTPARVLACLTVAAGPVTVRLFEGGHFYLHDDASDFRAAFSDVLRRLSL